MVLLKSESIKNLAASLSKAQSKITGALTDSSNPFFKSKYADLASVMDAIRIPFAENELSVTQSVMESNDRMFLCSLLMHSSGEYIGSNYPIMCKDMMNPQAIGSSITYARRYALAALAGVSQIDDDAETARKVPEHPGVEWVKSAQKVTDKQLKRLYAISQSSELSSDDISSFIKSTFNKTSSKDLLMTEYDKLVTWIENDGRAD